MASNPNNSSNELWQTIKGNGETLEVQVRPGTVQTNGKPFILLHDIQDVFPGAVRLTYNHQPLGFITDVEGNKLRPLRVPHIPGTVLKVVISSSHKSKSSHSSKKHSEAGATTTATASKTISSTSTPSLPSSSRHTRTKVHPSNHPYSPEAARQHVQLSSATSLSQANKKYPDLRLTKSSLQQKEQLPQRIPPLIDRTAIPQRRYPIPLISSSSTASASSVLTTSSVALRSNKSASHTAVPTAATTSSLATTMVTTKTKLTKPTATATTTAATTVTTTSMIAPNEEVLKSQYRKSVKIFESFLLHTQLGQTEQANCAQENFKKHFRALEAEMAKNKELQKKMVEMQQHMWMVQRGSFDQLAKIQNKIQEILRQGYELHDSPDPRLFIVLPMEDLKELDVAAQSHLISNSSISTTTSSSNSNNNISSSNYHNKFRLYFLCECGEHTRSYRSKMQHQIHLAKHEGYDLERPQEFFRRYGQYVLRLLQMLKYGVSGNGFSVSALNKSSLKNDLTSISRNITSNNHTIGNHNSNEKNLNNNTKINSNTPNFVYNNANFTLERVDQAIAYLQSLVNQDPITSAKEDVHRDTTTEIDSLLESADLRRLRTFLKNSSTDDVLGNQFRVVTSEGYVRWVCIDHYRDNYYTEAMRDLEDFTTGNGGVFLEQYGRVEITLTSQPVALQFYKTLERARAVQELRINFGWDISYQDAKALNEAIERSKIVMLELSCNASSSAVELLNRNKRAEALWQILSCRSIRSFSLQGYSGFFKKTAPADPRWNQLRVLQIDEEVDWKKDSARVIELLKVSPRLTKLTLGCNDVQEAYDAIRAVTFGRCSLTKLTLTAGTDEHLVAKFDQPGQILINMDLTIPTVPSYNSLLQSIDCISSLHISGPRAQYNDCGPLVDVIQRNRGLTELKVACYVSEFPTVYEAIRAAVTNPAPGAKRTLSKLKKVCLYRGENRLYTPDIRSPQLLVLEILQMRIHEAALRQVLNTFGPKLTKLRIDTAKWKPTHSATLLEAVGRLANEKSATRLTHLFQACADVDANALMDLQTVIERSNLIEYELIIDMPFVAGSEQCQKWINFIDGIGKKITALHIICPEPNGWIEAVCMRVGNPRLSEFAALKTVSFVHPLGPNYVSNTECQNEYDQLIVKLEMDSLGADNNKKNKTKSEDFSSVIYAAFHGLPNKPSKTGRRTSAPSTTFNSSEIILTEKSRSITPTPSTSGYNHHGGGDSTTATPRNGTRPH